MRAAIYCRVSSDDQADKGTIQNQLSYLRQRLELDQHEVTGEYLDDGVPGILPLGDRPEGRRLLADARLKKFDAVWFYRLDRLGRKLAVILDAEAQLTALGVKLKSGTEPIDTENAVGTFIFQLLGSIAQLERETIRERTQSGRERAKREGRWKGGIVPRGYQVNVETHRLEAGPDADLVREAFTALANGETGIAVGERLGIPRASLSRTVRNRIYIGESSAPALVSRELFDQAGAQLKKNLTTKIGESNLLRGIIKCECGRPFEISQAGGYHYYRCGSSLDPRKKSCGAVMVPSDALQEHVWREAEEILQDPVSLFDVDVFEQLSERDANRSQEIVKIRNELAGLQNDKAWAIKEALKNGFTKNDAEEYLLRLA